MQMLKGKIKVGVYQLQQGTRQLLCRLREQQKPYKENSSKESFSAALMFGLSQSLNFGSVYVSIISACYTGFDIKATM